MKFNMKSLDKYESLKTYSQQNTTSNLPAKAIILTISPGTTLYLQIRSCSWVMLTFFPEALKNYHQN